MGISYTKILHTILDGHTSSHARVRYRATFIIYKERSVSIIVSIPEMIEYRSTKLITMVPYSL